jgi:hypothetical protein
MKNSEIPSSNLRLKTERKLFSFLNPESTFFWQRGKFTKSAKITEIPEMHEKNQSYRLNGQLFCAGQDNIHSHFSE